MLVDLFIVRLFFNFLFLPCGELSWLHVSLAFYSTLNTDYRIVSSCASTVKDAHVYLTLQYKIAFIRHIALILLRIVCSTATRMYYEQN